MKKNINSPFENSPFDTLRYFSSGKTTIFPSGEIHLMRAGRCRVLTGKAARDFLEKRAKLKSAFSDWQAWRKSEIAAWKRNVPHHIIESDAGTLQLIVDGKTRVHVANGCGDGQFTVYIAPPSVPPTFSPAGVVISGAVSIKILDYDCGVGRTVDVVTLRACDEMSIWRDESGAMALVIVDKSEGGDQ